MHTSSSKFSMFVLGKLLACREEPRLAFQARQLVSQRCSTSVLKFPRTARKMLFTSSCCFFQFIQYYPYFKLVFIQFNNSKHDCECPYASNEAVVPSGPLTDSRGPR